jgi:hypothetical protein
MIVTKNFLKSPIFCQYTLSACDQDMDEIKKTSAFFVYPSYPPILADTIREAVSKLRDHTSNDNWKTWEQLNVGGKIIFCEICKAIRAADIIIANITTLNFNVLFEVGYALGLGKKVIPIRDSSFDKDNKIFNEIGIFDTLGYQKFTNSNDIVSIANKIDLASPPISQNPELNIHQPIYFIKAPIDNDAGIKILSCLKKSGFRFRTFDVKETSRLSLHEAHKQAMSSFSVITHLISPERDGSSAHNARAAFVCGIAMSAGKHVLMLQEGFSNQPIDYRDVIVPYSDSNMVLKSVEKIIRNTAETFQLNNPIYISLPKNLIERLDVGDVAAENEITPLIRGYFVKTPQFQQVRQGHARIVIGRKGTGKTALFYGIRSQYKPRRDKLVLDLKPEGHQFIRLREVVLNQLDSGLQEHTVSAFWHYLLLIEILGKIIDRESSNAYKDENSLKEYNKLIKLYNQHSELEGDFSERLMNLVNRLADRFPEKSSGKITKADITSIIYNDDIKNLNDVIIKRLHNSDGIWILMDNIDKGFPSRGLNEIDILIVRGLLEATRKIEHTFETKGIQCFTTIFIRRDVYDFLVDLTPDRGKETHANLDWSDLDLIKELLIKRFKYEVPELSENFDEAWNTIFASHVGAESSFNYIMQRTFSRPRDILNFVRKSIQVAVSHNHTRVMQDDIIKAEKEFSEDMFNELSFEMRDVFSKYPDILDFFLGSQYILSKDEIYFIFLQAELKEDDFDNVLDVLLWFSFIGVIVNEDEHFAYQNNYNTKKLLHLTDEEKPDSRVYVIHPAFRKALEI